MSQEAEPGESDRDRQGCAFQLPLDFLLIGRHCAGSHTRPNAGLFRAALAVATCRLEINSTLRERGPEDFDAVSSLALRQGSQLVESL